MKSKGYNRVIRAYPKQQLDMSTSFTVLLHKTHLKCPILWSIIFSCNSVWSFSMMRLTDYLWKMIIRRSNIFTAKCFLIIYFHLYILFKSILLAYMQDCGRVIYFHYIGLLFLANLFLSIVYLNLITIINAMPDYLRHFTFFLYTM